MQSNGGIPKDKPVPEINFRRASVRFGARTFAMRGDRLLPYTLTGRVTATLKPDEHQKRLLAWGRPKDCCTCNCGRRPHSGVNAASNHALLGKTALSPRADVNRPYVEEAGHVGL